MYVCIFYGRGCHKINSKILRNNLTKSKKTFLLPGIAIGEETEASEWSNLVPSPSLGSHVDSGNVCRSCCCPFRCVCCVFSVVRSVVGTHPVRSVRVRL